MKVDFLSSITLARALYVAASLDIASLLQDKKMNITELAFVLSVDKDSLERLLVFLELHEVFKKTTDGDYYNNEFSETMSLNHPHTIRPFLLHDDETRWNAFGNLEYSIKTGKPAFDALYHMGYFDYLTKHPQLSLRFDQAMTFISSQEDLLIAQMVPFNGVIADIGGGNGQLLKKIIDYNKTKVTEVVLFDLPSVLDAAQPTNFKKVVGSFFEPLDIRADFFILKRVLHDWKDEEALSILRNVAEAMQPDSHLYIFEGVLDCVKDKKALAAIDLLLLTLLGGKERTLENFQQLLQDARLVLIEHKNITDIMSVLVCKKSGSN